MLRIALIRPGSTSFDDELRIKGALDIPMSDCGNAQIEQTASELSGYHFDAIYSAPCESAIGTASLLGKIEGLKPKILDGLANLDHGLWQGKLIEEVRLQQPKVYKKFQEDPGSVRPPGGETLQEARARFQKIIRKWMKKHANEMIAIVVPNPMASIIRQWITDDQIGNLWQSECDSGAWEMLQVSERVLEPAN
jgi:broad specificity phosphatase PhoE